MARQSYMVQIDDGADVFDASTFQVRIQRILSDAGPDFQATAPQFPGLVAYGYKYSEAYVALLMKIERVYEDALKTGKSFPEQLLDDENEPG